MPFEESSIAKELINTIMAHRSIRKYTDEPVSDKDVDTMLEAAMAAPSSLKPQAVALHRGNRPADTGQPRQHPALCKNAFPSSSVHNRMRRHNHLTQPLGTRLLGSHGEHSVDGHCVGSWRSLGRFASDEKLCQCRKKGAGSSGDHYSSKPDLHWPSS